MKKFRIGSLFSGVGGFCGGFQDEGFEIAWQVEIDDAARGVLDHLYPKVPKCRDIRDVGAKCLPPVDVIVGGWPCTDLSVAGSRVGIDGKRSGMFWEMMRVVEELQPAWVVWENVPGLLSSFSPCENPPGGLEVGAEWEVEETSDYETVLRALAERGYCGATRILDAQLFGVPQRRERIFGVFTRLPAGAERAAEVLAVRQSLRGDSPKGREEGADAAGSLTAGTGSRGYRIGAEDAANGHLVAFGRNNTSGPIGTTGALMGQCGGRGDFETETFVLQCQGSNVGPMGTLRSGNGGVTGGVPVVIQDARGIGKAQNGLGFAEGGPAYTLQANNHQGVAMPQALHYTHDFMQDRVYSPDGISPALCANKPGGTANFLVPTEVVFPAAGVNDTLVATNSGGAGTPLSRVVCVTEPVTHTLTHEGADASEDGTGRGTPIIAFGCKDSDPKGVEGVSPTLRAMQGEHANGGGQVAIATVVNALTSSDGGADDSSAQPGHLIVMHGGGNAANQADAGEALRVLRREVGEEAFQEWSLGRLGVLQAEAVLQQELHGSGVRREAHNRDIVVNGPLPRTKGNAEGWLHSLWETICSGRSPPGQGLSEQRRGEFGAYLSLLSQQGAPKARFLHDLWQASEGLGLLRDALSAIQEARRPAEARLAATQEEVQPVREDGEREGAVRTALHAGEASQEKGGAGVEYVVRRLTPL